MDVGHSHRLGLVVPPENPTAEPEYARLAGTALNVYTARFPVDPQSTLREMLEMYNRSLPDVLRNFGRLRLDAAVVACSASHYLLSPEGDQAFCAEVSEKAGYPVQSSTQAILALCAELGFRRVTLVSPYVPWLTEVSRKYWVEAGLDVADVVPVPAGNVFDPYQVTTEQLVTRLRDADLPAADALLCTGTGMHTLAALTELDELSGQVLLSSNLASVWWAFHNMGVPTVHPLLRRLAG